MLVVECGESVRNRVLGGLTVPTYSDEAGIKIEIKEAMRENEWKNRREKEMQRERERERERGREREEEKERLCVCVCETQRER